MGKRGPTGTPDKIKALRGSWRAKKPKDTTPPSGGDVPVSTRKRHPNAPTWLSIRSEKDTTPSGRDIWNNLAPGLFIHGLLTDADIFTFGRYCETLALWLKTAAALKAGMIRDVYDGKTIDDDGRQVPVSYEDRPEVSRLIRLGESLNRLEAKFGLDPSSRANLPTVEQERKPGTDALSRGLG